MNIKLSVDTLGSETSLSEIILGLSESSLRCDDYFFYLFGNEENINLLEIITKRITLFSLF